MLASLTLYVWCAPGRRKNLYTGLRAAPPPVDAKGTEAKVAPNLYLASKQVVVDVGLDARPLRSVKVSARLDSRKSVPLEPKRHSAGAIRKRKVEPVSVSRVTAILPRTTNTSFKQEPKVLGIELRPVRPKEILGHRTALRGSSINWLLPTSPMLIPPTCWIVSSASLNTIVFRLRFQQDLDFRQPPWAWGSREAHGRARSLVYLRSTAIAIRRYVTFAFFGNFLPFDIAAAVST